MEQRARLQEQVDGMKKDMDELDAHIHKTEMDKNAKDNQIKTLNSEMALQDEQLSMYLSDLYVFQIALYFIYNGQIGLGHLITMNNGK